MTFDITKPVQTRDGRKVRIICTDMKGTKWPILGLIENENGNESTQSFQVDGTMFGVECEHINDLINIPERKEFWVNVFALGLFGRRHMSRQEAEADVANEAKGRIGLLKLTIEGDKLVGAEVVQ